MLAHQKASPVLMLEPPSADLLVADEQGPRLLLAEDCERAVSETLRCVFRQPVYGSWLEQATDPVDPMQGWDAQAAARLLWRVCRAARARLSLAQMDNLLKEGARVEEAWWLHVTADEDADPYAGLGLSEVDGGAALVKMVYVAWHDGNL